MASSVEDLVNQALRRIGAEPPIAYIYEGSRAARAALDVYGDVRDGLLRERDWPFARREALGSTVIGPPELWPFQFTYPADCLRVRSVKPAGMAAPVMDPRPVRFSIFNTGAVRTILSTVNPAMIVYTGQIVDMTTWEPLFTQALVERLALRLSVALTGSGDLLKAEAEMADMATATAVGAAENHPPSAIPMAERRG